MRTKELLEACGYAGLSPSAVFDLIARAGLYLLARNVEHSSFSVDSRQASEDLCLVCTISAEDEVCFDLTIDLCTHLDELGLLPGNVSFRLDSKPELGIFCASTL